MSDDETINSLSDSDLDETVKMYNEILS
jgi:hypothetical protein